MWFCKYKVNRKRAVMIRNLKAIVWPFIKIKITEMYIYTDS